MQTLAQNQPTKKQPNHHCHRAHKSKSNQLPPQYPTFQENKKKDRKKEEEQQQPPLVVEPPHVATVSGGLYELQSWILARLG